MHMDEIFPTPHPTLACFVNTLEEEGRDQAQRLEDIRKGERKAPAHDGAMIREPLVCYEFF